MSEHATPDRVAKLWRTWYRLCAAMPVHVYWYAESVWRVERFPKHLSICVWRIQALVWMPWKAGTRQ